jgi:hypothetical protein
MKHVPISISIYVLPKPTRTLQDCLKCDSAYHCCENFELRTNKKSETQTVDTPGTTVSSEHTDMTSLEVLKIEFNLSQFDS